MKQVKLFRITTIPLSLNVLLRGQLAFLNRHFRVTGISSPGAELEEVREREGIEVRAIKMEREIALAQDWRSLLALIRLFRKERPEIVHANTPKASLLAMIAARWTRVPLRIYTVTGLRFEGFPPSLKRKILVNMERLTCAMATHVIPEGNGVKDALYKNRVTRKELNVVANGNINGVDTRYFSPSAIAPSDLMQVRLQYSIEAGDFVFCFVGRLVRDKGIVELYQAFAQLAAEHTGLKLLLVGPFEHTGNALPDDIVEKIKSHKQIITTGFQSDIRPFLGISHTFVFPSYREGFPNVVMQAGAMELPCIVTDINGSNEIVQPGVNGLIIGTGSVPALYDAMSALFSDRHKLELLKSKSRTMIEDRYEQEYVWAQLLNRYREYLAEKKIPFTADV
ncbi:glycosyltransferase family 4 protein [Taibaiella koreensis]|uniref:glycosyltransferase family 4 protein n=1 Tax=Taibaiella koreensis TaxID=1268548 RepID=UPI000E59B4B9|nr:glycosyltransferase family 4 protein [Taibaiella koreensis]